MRARETRRGAAGQAAVEVASESVRTGTSVHSSAAQAQHADVHLPAAADDRHVGRHVTIDQEWQASISGTCCSRDKYRDRWNTPGASSMRFPLYVTIDRHEPAGPHRDGADTPRRRESGGGASRSVQLRRRGRWSGALDVTIVAHIYDVAHDLGIAPVERLLEPSVLTSRADAITTLLRSRYRAAGRRPPARRRSLVGS